MHDSTELDATLAQVSRLGWKEIPGLGELVIFAVPGGHRLLWVPSTGRLQLRLDYGIALEQRMATAQAVVSRLVAQSSLS